LRIVVEDQQGLQAVGEGRYVSPGPIDRREILRPLDTPPRGGGKAARASKIKPVSQHRGDTPATGSIGSLGNMGGEDEPNAQDELQQAAAVMCDALGMDEGRPTHSKGRGRGAERRSGNESPSVKIARAFFAAATVKSGDDEDILPQEDGADEKLSVYYLFSELFPENVNNKEVVSDSPGSGSKNGLTRLQVVPLADVPSTVAPPCFVCVHWFLSLLLLSCSVSRSGAGFTSSRAVPATPSGIVSAPFAKEHVPSAARASPLTLACAQHTPSSTSLATRCTSRSRVGECRPRAQSPEIRDMVSSMRGGGVQSMCERMRGCVCKF